MKYTIRYELNDKVVDIKEIPDPFVNGTIVIGLRYLFKGLLRGNLKVGIVVNGDKEAILRFFSSGLEVDDATETSTNAK